MSTSKTPRVIGWVLTGLLAIMLIGLSASGKFTEWEGKAEMFKKIGFTTDLVMKIGVVEVVITPSTRARKIWHNNPTSLFSFPFYSPHRG